MKNSPDLVSFISALSIHLIIAGVLLMNVDFDLPKEKPQETFTIIDTSLVSQKMFDDLAQLKTDKAKEEQRLKDEARKQKEREEAEKARQAALLKKQEEERVQAEKAEVLRKKQEAERVAAEKALAAKVLKEKKEAAEALKIKQAAEKKALEEKQALEKVKAQKLAQEKVAKEKAAKEKAIEDARLKAIEDARIKAEKEAKIKAEKEAKIKAEQAAEAERLRQEELDRQMEAEFSEDFSSARNAKQLSEIAKYEVLIRGKISRNWKVDPTMSGSSCTLAIKLAPDGLVISAEMSSGDKRLCDSARRAALAARTLPIPSDPEIAPQFRDFDITLEPDL